MTHKIINTGNYLFIMDTSKTDPFDSSKIGDPIAHLPLNNSPIIDGVDLLPPYSRHQEDDLDKKSFEFVRYIGGTEAQRLAYQDGYIDAREKYKYTEEDMKLMFEYGYRKNDLKKWEAEDCLLFFHQYPTEFECEMETMNIDEIRENGKGFLHSETKKPKTITTAQGVQWLGKYK